MKPTRIYRTWIAALITLIAVGILCYVRQIDSGLGITGISRDVTWGLYIGQFIFAEGIAASMAILLLDRGKLTLIGVWIAIAGVIASMLFIVADMGQPSRVFNVLRYPSPHSIMFWDMLSLSGYLALNIVVGAALLDCQRKEVPMPRWLRQVILVSIAWAIAMQTVAAFLFCGLPGRSFWLTAILAPRFIAGALASGPALLVLLERLSQLQLPDGAPRKLALIVGYAMALNLFFILLEIFTTFYSGIPEPIEHFRSLFSAPWMWTSMVLAVASLILLRRNPGLACAAAFLSLWIDKGFAMVSGGFAPSEYLPTAPEVAIAAAIWAIAALIVTLAGTRGDSRVFRASNTGFSLSNAVSQKRIL